MAKSTHKADLSATHPDVEFQALSSTGRGVSFKDFDGAAAFVVSRSLSDGVWSSIYVVVRSEAGAHWWGGDAAVEQYRSDPDASVFEKINVKAVSEGMIS